MEIKDYFEFKNGSCISFTGLLAITTRMTDILTSVSAPTKIIFKYEASGTAEVDFLYRVDSLQEFEEDLIACKNKWHEYRKEINK